MSNNVKSAKGVEVNFDLLKIKEQIASAPTPTEVKARQDFIDKKLRRRLKKVNPPAPKIAPIEVEPVLPTTEDTAEAPVAEAPTEPTKKKTRTRQKAR